MTKNCAIVCEYNPFHTGHLYQLNKVRDFGAENIFCIMSGQFVQSALPAFCDKALRAECAVMGGADAVIELPAVYATAAAWQFAEGAIKIISGIKDITHIAMGAFASSDTILRTAELKIKNENSFSKELKKELDSGKSYNTAGIAALTRLYNKAYPGDHSVDEVFIDPNSILAIEYICAIDKFASSIQPLIIKREGGKYNDTDISEKYISASAIRQAYETDNTDKVLPYIPYMQNEMHAFYREHAADMSLYGKMAVFALKKSTPDELNTLRDCSEGLEYLLKNFDKYSNFEQYIDSAVCRRYGKKRIYRLFTSLLLGITKNAATKKFVTRLLACKKNFDFSLLPECVKITNSAIKKAAENPEIAEVLKIDETASALYNTLCSIDGDYYNYSLIKR